MSQQSNNFEQSQSISLSLPNLYFFHLTKLIILQVPKTRIIKNSLNYAIQNFCFLILHHFLKFKIYLTNHKCK